MRALWRYCLTPALLTAAVLASGGAAPSPAAAAHPAGIALASHVCPSGTNWDDAVKACV